jgi:hypothetical protein
MADLGAAHLSVANQSGNELPADHPGRADHGNMHAVHLPTVDRPDRRALVGGLIGMASKAYGAVCPASGVTFQRRRDIEPR